MTKTLVSFIGRGQKDKDERKSYLQAEYDFHAGAPIKSAVFFDAILRSKLFSLDTCILIGTKTSSWAVLLDHDLKSEGKYIELYEKLEKETNSEGVSREILEELQKALEDIWGKRCICYANAPKITEENCFEIISDYFALISEEVKQDVIVDITHGFRSMPVLLTVALQFKDCLGDQQGLEIIYGEYNRNGPSPVRYLKPLWKGIKISQATRLFFEKFDPEALTSFLENFWPSGATAISKLGGDLQTNYILFLDDSLENLKKATEKFTPESSPKWSQAVVQKLKKIHKRLTKPKTQKKKLLERAKLFGERHLYAQAVTALRLSYEAFLFEYYDEKYFDYHVCQDLASEFWKESDWQQRQHIQIITNERNVVAHGGTSADGIQQVSQKVPKQYEECLDFLTKLYQKYSK